MRDYSYTDVMPADLSRLNQDRQQLVSIEEANSVMRNEHVDLRCLAALMPLGLVDTMAMHHPQTRKSTCKGCLTQYSILPSLWPLARASCVHPS